jgi:hypothetical protein
VVQSETTLLHKLQSWWSNYYERPLKDPLLESYTLEELLYEYHDKVERRKAEEQSSDKEADRIEEERIKTSLDWAEEEERKELETIRVQEAEEAKRKAEEQIEIERQIEIARNTIGGDFSDDIDTDFGDN